MRSMVEGARGQAQWQLGSPATADFPVEIQRLDCRVNGASKVAATLKILAMCDEGSDKLA